MTVSPPRTRSPTRTRTSRAARHDQIRARAEADQPEPLARPRACRPGRTRHTMRRASTPAICAHRRPARAHPASAIVAALVPLRRLGPVGGEEAARARTRRPTTSPAMGERLTCTSSGDRKIDTRTAGPDERVVHGSATSITRPSAGASDRARHRGRRPLGVAEEAARKASAATAKGTAAVAQPAHAEPGTRRGAGGTRMNGQPSAAIGTRIRDRSAAPPLRSHPRRLDPATSSSAAACRPPRSGARPRACRMARKLGAVGLVLEHPLARELAASGSRARIFFISASRLVVDDPRPARVVAVLRGVGDRVAHVGEPALVEQVDDQLHLVHALEVGDLGLVAGLDQRLEGGLDQVRDAAAERRSARRRGRSPSLP